MAQAKKPNQQNIDIDYIYKAHGCSEEDRCRGSDLQNLCKAELYCDGKLIRCLDPNPLECPSSYSFGNIFLCKCKVRRYIAQNLERRD